MHALQLNGHRAGMPISHLSLSIKRINELKLEHRHSAESTEVVGNNMSIKCSILALCACSY